MSTIRSTVLRLGLLNVPVKVQTAITDSAPRFNTVCTHGHAPTKVKQSLACPACGNADRATFEKGHDNGDGTITVVNPDDLAQHQEVPAEVKEAITLSVHPAEDVDNAVPGGRTYWLAPGKGGEAGYTAFVAVLRAHPDHALCTVFATRSRPSMYRVALHDDALMLVELAWPGDVTSIDVPEGDAPEAMVQQLALVISSASTPFDPSTYFDARAKAVEDFLSQQQAVAAGITPEDASEGGAPAANDLASQLAAMLKEQGASGDTGRCAAKTKSGKQCKRKATEGSFCATHEAAAAKEAV